MMVYRFVAHPPFRVRDDTAWVEQKNWTHVRKLVGYRLMATAAQCEVLRELYEAAADFRNFFQPAMKLKEKEREGGKCGASMKNRARPINACWSWGNSGRTSGGRWRSATGG
jgi:hypothetical protein